MPLPEVKLLHLRRCSKTSSRFLQRRTKRLGLGGQKCWLKDEYVGICWDELWFVEVFCSCARVLAYRVYIPAKLSIVKIERYLKEKNENTSLNAWMTLEHLADTASKPPCSSFSQFNIPLRSLTAVCDASIFHMSPLSGNTGSSVWSSMVGQLQLDMVDMWLHIEKRVYIHSVHLFVKILIWLVLVLIYLVVAMVLLKWNLMICIICRS